VEYLANVLGLLGRFGGDGRFGHGPGWVLPVMLVVGAILVFLFVFFLFLLIRSFYRSEIAPRKKLPETPLEIVQRRYALGEITSEEFEKIKQDLRET
jgi:uncharacterized membrane protein